MPEVCRARLQPLAGRSEIPGRHFSRGERTYRKVVPGWPRIHVAPASGRQDAGATNTARHHVRRGGIEARPFIRTEPCEKSELVPTESFLLISRSGRAAHDDPVQREAHGEADKPGVVI